MAGHLLSTMDRIAEGDAQRRDEAMAKAGAEATSDVDWDEQLAKAEADDIDRQGGLPEGAEPLEDVEVEVVYLPEIGTPVRYQARRNFMRRRQSEFPAFVLGHRPEEGTVDLFVMLDSDDTIVEERVLPHTDEEPYHCFVLLGGDTSGIREQIDKLWAEFGLLRSQIFGEYVDPPKSVMDYLAGFEEKLNALQAAAPKPRGKAGKD